MVKKKGRTYVAPGGRISSGFHIIGFDLLSEVLSFAGVNLYRPIRRLGRSCVFNPRLKKDRIKLFRCPGRHVFFGYYDVTPFSQDGTLLLAMHGPRDHRPPSADAAITVGVYDLRSHDSSLLAIGETLTWCWQQGCRLQWYPSTSNSTIIYNRLVEGGYGCVVQDIRTRNVVRSYARPIYSVTRDGRWGFSLNFSRLHRLRPGYGYVNFEDVTRDELAPKDDGIWRIDMATGREELLFSLAEIASLEPLPGMSGSAHYFNHILCNPSSERFLFFHLWVNRGIRFSRLITCGVAGQERHVLINEGHVSHYTWKSDAELLAYSSHLDTGTSFYLYQDKSRKRETVAAGLLDQDGHPSYSPDDSFLIVDTYPDRLREQHLFLYRCRTRELEWLGAFFCPMKFKTTDVRCDLHPRWSHGGQYVCVDSACTGHRAMYVLDLQDLL